MRIGVLALQGAFREHLNTLASIGVEGVPVRLPADLDSVDGLILPGGEAPILPLLDVTVQRNAFGRQLDSFEADLAVPVLGDQPVHGVFIRAPVIDRTGPDVDILSRLDDGRIVAVRERNIIAAAFHPELAGETRFHRLVATMAAAHADPGEGAGRRHHPTRRSRSPS